MGSHSKVWGHGLVTRDDFWSAVAADLGRFRVIIDGLRSKANDFIH